MKALIILLTTLISFSSQAKNRDDIDPVVLKSFQKSFKNAQEADWTATKDYFKVQFALDGQHINAFYNTEGELLAITKNITTNQLPVMLQMSLKQQTDKYWITELFECSTEQGIAYYATIENADMKITLQAGNNSPEWNVFRKSHKI